MGIPYLFSGESFIKTIHIDNQNHKGLEQLYKVIKKTGDTDLREIFDINSHEFKVLDDASRIEIFKYFLSFQEIEVDSDLIGSSLWDVIDQYCDVFDKDSEIIDIQNLALYIAEYLLRNRP